MEVGLDELIKWILAQYDDLPSDELRASVYREIFPEGKEEQADEQKRDKHPCTESAVGR